MDFKRENFTEVFSGKKVHNNELFKLAALEAIRINKEELEIKNGITLQISNELDMDEQEKQTELLSTIAMKY